MYISICGYRNSLRLTNITVGQLELLQVEKSMPGKDLTWQNLKIIAAKIQNLNGGRDFIIKDDI
jgi:hypothetical protein